MANATPAGLTRALTGYYGATIGFLVLDFGLGFNVRVSFLDAYPGWRVAYYLVLVACLVAMIIRPGWTVAVTAIESLVTLVALILSTALRAMLPGVAFGEEPVGLLGVQEVLNFLFSGSAAYLTWNRSITTLFGRQ